MASTESNSSRFNPFKFNSKPPPLPPKDPIYLRSPPAPTTAFVGDNTTTTTTAPSSPISPTIQYAIRRANSPSPFSSVENNHIFATNMNYSASSLLSPPPSSQPPQQVQRQDSTSSKHSNGNSRHISTTSSKKDKALAFLKFPKRSPRSPPPPQAGPSNLSTIDSVMVIGSDEGEDVPPPPQEDDNISLPWNFQVRALRCASYTKILIRTIFSFGSIIYTSTMGMFFLIFFLSFPLIILARYRISD